MSRRNVLRGAAILGGTAATTPLMLSLSESAVASGAANTTLARTYAPDLANANAKGYARIVPGPGEEHVVRAGAAALGAEAFDGPEHERTALLAFAQFSDIHVVDHQSPGRVEWLDRFEDPNDQGLTPGLLSSSYRPQEILTAQIADAMVQAVNTVKFGPVTHLPLAFMIETGDNSDNCQKNEIRWNIDILDGRTVRPDSGNLNTYEGVMDNNALYYDTHYWHPDGTPLLKSADRYRANHGYPVVPNLLAAARRPFDAAGLDIPWYTVFGNHDGLIQGNFPNSTTQLDQISRGPVKVITVPPGVTQTDVLEAVENQDLAGLLSSINLLGARVVTPDPARKNLSRREVVEEYFATTSSPAGHGYTEENRTNGTAYYFFDKGSFRFVALDTTNPNGYADGSLDQAQFAWLKATVQAATGKAVLVFSHHTSSTMTNPLVLTGGDPSLRVLGPDVTSYLLSQPRVVAWVNGHTHVNEITPHARADGSGGFWEINTASHIDYPQQARLLEVVDNNNGTLSIFSTIVDHAGTPTANYGDLSSTVSLAGIARELAVNDPQNDLATHTGSPEDRNAELLLPTPVELQGVLVPASPAMGAPAQSSAGLGVAAALVGGAVAAKVISRREEGLRVDV